MEAIVTQGEASIPNQSNPSTPPTNAPPVKVGDGPLHVVQATAEQMFLDIKPEQAVIRPSLVQGDLNRIFDHRRFAHIRGIYEAVES